MHSGKIIWAKGNEIQTANLKLLDEGVTAREGEKVPLSVKDRPFGARFQLVFARFRGFRAEKSAGHGGRGGLPAVHRAPSQRPALCGLWRW